VTNAALISSSNFAAEPRQRQSSGVTELVLANDSLDQLALILPMIAFLSHSHTDRWISWITPHPIARKLLEAYGVNTGLIRFIHCEDGEKARWIAWEALAAGTSHTVIASPGKLGDKDMNQLELAAHQGNAQGLLLRLR
jgi:cell division inhibitor SulA